MRDKRFPSRTQGNARGVIEIQMVIVGLKLCFKAGQCKSINISTSKWEKQVDAMTMPLWWWCLHRHATRSPNRLHPSGEQRGLTDLTRPYRSSPFGISLVARVVNMSKLCAGVRGRSEERRKSCFSSTHPRDLEPIRPHRAGDVWR